MPPRPTTDLLEANKRFYDPLWTQSRLVDAARFNTWSVVQTLLAPGQRRLEVAPGLRPRFPVTGTSFLDASEAAVAKLRAGSADAVVGEVSRLPYADATFDLLGAFDVIEHVVDDDAALAELARVAAPGATLLVSAPLHPSRWTPFDDLVGHFRRYEPAELTAKLSRHGFSVVTSAVYGMQPKSTRVLDWGVRQLTENPERAIWWYDRVLLPLAMWFQSELVFQPGMLNADAVDEVLLRCRRST